MAASTETPGKCGPKEGRFLDALRDLFVGAKVDGESGYINLMRIKASYFAGIVEPALMEDIATALKDFPGFREEMFDKLHAFFSRYFSRSGAICFAYTPNHFSVYERVYTDEQDVVLFWKTHMLYYVKTDRLFRDLKVEVDGESFFFNCSELKHKSSNEKRTLVHTFAQVEPDGVIRLNVTYSQRGRLTKTAEILKAAKKAQRPLQEAPLEKAIQVFGRQSEVDYFINKDARGFLQEQFDLWMYQYMFRDQTHWTAGRVEELQALKSIALRLIDFIAQFEDELVRIWNKPKFVRDSHYVVTLDRLASQQGGLDVITGLAKHKGMQDQIAEWIGLGLVEKGFNAKSILGGRPKKRQLDENWQFLPVDTRYFKSLELEVIGLFDNLDEELDGRLIKSDNYQALNTLQEKYRERVQCIYIDPPYNTGQDDFLYADAMQSASWLTLMTNRIGLAKRFLRPSGSMSVSIDDHEVANCRHVLDQAFTRTNRAALPTIKRGSATGHKAINPGMVNLTEYVALYSADKESWKPNRVFRARGRNERYSSFIRGRDKPTSEWQFCSLLEAFSESKGIAKGQLRKELGRAFESDLFKFIIENKDSVIRFARPDPDKVSEEIRTAIKTSKRHPKKIVHVPREDQPDFFLKDGERILFYADLLKRVDGRLTTVEPLSDIWDDVMPNDLHNEGGVTLKKGKKPEKLLHRIIELTTQPRDLILDFFMGSGTSPCVAQKTGRRWIGVEQADYFDEIALVRMKRVLAGDPTGVSSSVNWSGGGFFKYCSMESYEDALSTSAYSGDEDDLFRNTKKDPYSQYVFFRDEKLARVLELDYEKDDVNVDLSKLYPDIDLAETLSCVTGKWIRRITKGEVEFTDGSKENLVKPNWKLLKPLIFWGPAE